MYLAQTRNLLKRNGPWDIKDALDKLTLFSLFLKHAYFDLASVCTHLHVNEIQIGIDSCVELRLGGVNHLCHSHLLLV